MDKKAEHLVAWALVLLSVVAAIGGVIVKLADMGGCHPNGGDLATWVGAVFTGLAFAGTIYIADTERRERRDANLKKMELVGALVYRISKSANELRNFFCANDVTSVFDFKWDTITEHGAALRMIPITDYSDIDLMLYIVNLRRYLDDISKFDGLKQTFDDAVAYHEKICSEDFEEILVNFYIAATDADSHCKKFLNKKR